jgi:hypothetical protein
VTPDESGPHAARRVEISVDFYCAIHEKLMSNGQAAIAKKLRLRTVKEHRHAEAATARM